MLINFISSSDNFKASFTLSSVQETSKSKAGKDAEAVASETTYESGEGNAVIIPLPPRGGGSPMMTTGRRKRGSGVKVKTVVLDDTELALYGGK